MNQSIFKFIFFFSGLILASSCNNDEYLRTEGGKNENKIEIVSIYDYLPNNAHTRSLIQYNQFASNVLKFKDETTFQEILTELETLELNEREAWSPNLENFASLQEIFNQAMEDVEFVDETEESYMNFKAKYDKYLYFPMYEEDYGVYIPIIEQKLATIANPDGYVVVGNEVRNLRNISSYADLQKSGQAYYDIINNPSGINPASNTLFNTKSKHIGKEMDSGWYTENKRKLRLKFGRVSNKKNINPLPPSKPGELPKPGGKFAMNLHLEVSFRKKTWIGWVNYKSITETNFTYRINGTTYKEKLRKNSTSSHDWNDKNALPWRATGQYSNGRPIFSTPAIEASFVTEFRGFKNKYNWKCTLPIARFVEY